jgi:hypothetical protein
VHPWWITWHVRYAASHGSKCIDDTASNSDYTASNGWMIVNNELERKQKEDIMAFV